MKTILLSILMALSCGFLNAQEVLTLERAFETAVSNNYQIKVLKSQQAIAANNANMGNAGLLPSVAVDGSYGANVNNTELEFAGDIPPVSQDNAQSSTISAGATVNYVVFGGLVGQRTFQKLKLNRLAVDEQSRSSIEATLLQVATLYYSVSQMQESERIAEKNLEVSKVRFQRAEIANELGTVLRTELLSARVDLTTDSSNFLNTILQRKTSLRNLCRAMGISYDESMQVEDAEIELKDWTEEQLMELAQNNNATLKNLELQKAIAEKDLQISWSSIFPTISISGGYSYTNQQNEAGIVLSNTATGWNGRVGLSYTLFNGFRNQNSRENQQILLETSALAYEDQKLQLMSEIGNAYDAYRQSVEVLSFEQNNLAASELNLQRSDELLKAGQITSTQFREAQLALANAKTRILNARVSVRLNELDIMRLTGQILSYE